MGVFWATSVVTAQEPTPEPESTSEAEEKSYFISNEALGITPNASYTVTLGAWRNMRPTESYLRRISMLPPDIEVDCSSDGEKSRGWIVGNSGTILGYCNGIWEQFISVESIPTTLYDVHALDKDLAVAVGEQGTILLYLYDEVAENWVWTKSPIPVGNQSLLGVSLVWDDSTGKYYGWAVGNANDNGKGTLVQGILTPNTTGVQKTYDYQWINQTNLYPSLPNVSYYHDVVLLSRNNGWAVGGLDGEYGTILHWNGSQWSLFQKIGNGIIRAIHMISPNEGWAVGVWGTIYHYNGSTWSSVESPTNEHLTSVGVDAEGTLWAVGGNGTILKYFNGKWTLFTDLRTDPFDFRDLDFNSGHGWLVAMNMKAGFEIGGQILEYDQQDEAWVAATVATDNRLSAVSNVSENKAWAVGNYDSKGGTILHWDGKHWQRWYQEDVPIPSVDLYTIDMISENDGWAAGDPKVSGGPAVFLHWDGRRWSEIAYNAPVNVRVTSIAMLNNDFGWAVADNGNAVARWDSLNGYWMAPHTCQGIFYLMRGASIVPKIDYDYGDAWAVAEDKYVPAKDHFMRYMYGCEGGFAWDHYEYPSSPDGSEDGPTATDLRGISMMHDDSIGTWGYAVGNYKERACIYRYTDATGDWSILWCEADDVYPKPSRFYSTDIVEESGVGWFAGYYDPGNTNYKKRAYIAYDDHSGLHWMSCGKIFPINGVNIYHRPILNLDMASDTMGWAVGAHKNDVSDGKNLSVIYQYPYPNFTLDIDPTTQVVKPGGSTSYTVTVNSIGGFDTDVNLDIIYTPPNISTSIVPTSTNSQTTSNVFVNTNASVTVDNYLIPLYGHATFRSGDNIIPVTRSFPLNLIVTDNPIYSIVPSHGPVSTTITLNGEGFGSDPGKGNRSTNEYNVTWADKKLADSNILSWSDTQITFHVPDDPSLFEYERFPLAGNVQVTADSKKSNDNLTFQLENYISSVDASFEGGEITGTIYGTSFGRDPGEAFRSTSYEHISLGGNWAENDEVLYWSNNVITFTTESFAPVTLTVTSNGYESNEVMFPPGSMQIFLPMTVR